MAKEKECVAPGVEHDLEFVVCAFGQHTWQCKLCGDYFDEPEDVSL